MMMSMYSGVSGLKSQQTKLNVIGNNIANINTLGYKGQSVSFNDMLSQTISSAQAPSTTQGGKNAAQIGTGSSVASITSNMNAGSTQATGSSKDVALTGDGFFVVQAGSNASQYQFTRAGNFGVDTEGNLVVNGLNVCGWENYTRNADGSISYNTQTAVSPINIFGNAVETVVTEAEPAAATTRATMNGTLAIGNAAGAHTTQSFSVYDANGVAQTLAVTLTQTSGAGVTPSTWTWATTFTGASGTTGTATAATGAISFDAEGNMTTIAGNAQQEWTLTTAAPAKTSTFTIDLSGLKANTVTTATTDTYINSANGHVPVNAAETTVSVNKQVMAAAATTQAAISGNLDATSATGAATLTAYDALGISHEVKLTYTKGATDASGNTTWNWVASSTDETISVAGAGSLVFNNQGVLTSGSTGTLQCTSQNSLAAPMNVTLDLSAIAQYTSSTGASSLSVDSIDGYEAGTLQDFSIGSDGVLTGSYSNGRSQTVGMVGLAVFNNPAGLEKIGENLYETTVNSGTFSGAVAVGTGGAGGLATSSLEMSNVDLASEFSEMMITQRAYQANSKIITTSDTLLETLINMSR